MFRSANSVLLSALVAAALTAIFISCSGGSVSRNEGAAQESLSQAESRFNPADYDRDPSLVKNADEHGTAHAPAAQVPPPVRTDTVRGFRVQVLFTPDIEEANRIRDTLSSALPHEYIYVVYDSPYYKVRAGNFTERSDANALVHTLVGCGYKDAWVVPDIVIINLPPRDSLQNQPAPVDTTRH